MKIKTYIRETGATVKTTSHVYVRFDVDTSIDGIIMVDWAELTKI